MKLKKIKAKKVKDGDILYVSHNYMECYNEEMLGGDPDLTGSDIIIIVDDIGGDDCWLINGGHEFYVADDNAEFIKIGHYKELFKKLKLKHSPIDTLIIK